MGSAPQPARVVLLAVFFATNSDIDSLRALAAQHREILRNVLLLRILLTYVPETTHPSKYAEFVREISQDEIPQESDDAGLDFSPLGQLTDSQASKKARKLHLLQLTSADALGPEPDDVLSQFLFQRAYKMDEDAGMLSLVPDLLVPFLDQSPAIRTWVASTILPLIRRNFDYYSQNTAQHSLREFQSLPDLPAMEYLLSRTDQIEGDVNNIGRDLRGLAGPWLYNDSRWNLGSSNESYEGKNGVSCQGWQYVLDWLVLHASKSWKVTVDAIEEWDGPSDADLGDAAGVFLRQQQLDYLSETYIRAALASAYLIPEPSMDALTGAYRIVSRAWLLFGQDQLPSFHASLEHLPALPAFSISNPAGTKVSATHMRNDLLQSSNPLTAPSVSSMNFLQGLILSASVMTRLGIPYSVKRAGEMVLLRDAREQKGELVKLVRLVLNQASRSSDEYWIRARREILWLHNWGNPNAVSGDARLGIFGLVSESDVETELLKAMLSSMCYSLAKSIYEDTSVRPLPDTVVQDAVYHAALDAFDNASNPNRTRGGLKKCNDIIHALPLLVPRTLESTKQIEALLSAAHALSSYRLVLKQGEPFSPVVLRVHSDPVSILDKVLEQNKGAYTRLQEFLEIGTNMITASFLIQKRPGKIPNPVGDLEGELFVVEKRIVAMCISAALKEDDFETAYSYVVSRLGDSAKPSRNDTWSWNVALQAGQYIRTSRSQQPTHLGTASGNLKIRHLEQRLECLAMALRVAPPSELQTILESFRKCEAQLDAAISDEAAKEAAWDETGDLRGIPGAFDEPTNQAYPARNITASSTARQQEEAPMSLFDLSRATARVASRNLTSLSSLRDFASGGGGDHQSAASLDTPGDSQNEPRARKRDQLREAATGTLVSGVGWLIGANVNRQSN
ncbi:hypothetical protein V2G26_020412 [Clonostachys chloroleuca]